MRSGGKDITYLRYKTFERLSKVVNYMQSFVYNRFVINELPHQTLQKLSKRLR